MIGTIVVDSQITALYKEEVCCVSQFFHQMLLCKVRFCHVGTIKANVIYHFYFYLCIQHFDMAIQCTVIPSSLQHYYYF